MLGITAVCYEILYRVLGLFFDMYAGLNTLVFESGVFGFSFTTIIQLIPDSFEYIAFFYLEKLGLTTVINLYTLFFSIKSMLRLIPLIGKLF
mgnify:CR=1 FL=1